MRAKIIRLMAPDPEELGGGEARHGLHAGDRGEARHVARQRRAFLAAAGVVPQHHRAEHGHVLAEKHGGVHLARQADGLDRRDRGRLLRREARRSRLRPPRSSHCGSCSLQPGSGRAMG